MIFLLDNYDSFTYNLVQRLGEIDPTLELVVGRNDELTVDQIAALKPSHIIVSPGPCTPNEAGVSLELISRLAGQMPRFSAFAWVINRWGRPFGATIVRAERLMHGKTDQIHHRCTGLFAGLPSPLTATRYHSLIIQPETLPGDFEVTAWSQMPDGQREIMAITHRKMPLYGVQFHPESFLTEHGTAMLENFLKM